MSTFDAKDFAELNAAEIRVRVTLQEDFELDAGKSWLGIDIISPAGRHQGIFELNQESIQSREETKGFFTEPEQVLTYTLSLNPASRVKFIDLQQFVSKAVADEVSIRVVPILASYPQDATSVTVTLELLLSQAQGFFTLVDAAQLPLGKQG